MPTEVVLVRWHVAVVVLVCCIVVTRMTRATWSHANDYGDEVLGESIWVVVKKPRPEPRR